MKIKTQDLTGTTLDWAVAKCEGVNEEAFRLYYTPTESSDLDTHGFPEFHYSTIWAQGGPIIEREGMTVGRQIDPTQWAAEAFDASGTTTFVGYGPTPLVAAMRCFVASKLGKEVEIPEELA